MRTVLITLIGPERTADLVVDADTAVDSLLPNLISGLPMNPLSTLGDLIFQGRDAGIHVILARACGGAARAMLDPVIGRLVESGAPALLMSGDPHEGPLLRGVRAEPLPPGRGRLLRRRGRAALLQLADTGVTGPTIDPDGKADVEHAVVSGNQ